MSLPQSALTPKPVAVVLAKAPRRDEATPIPTPSQATSALKHTPPAPPVPQERPSSPRETSRRHTPISLSISDSSPASKPSAPLPTPNESGPKQSGQIDARASSSAELRNSSIAGTTSKDNARIASKSRTLDTSPGQSRTEEPHSQIVNAIPIPSTERNGNVTEPTNDNLTPAVSRVREKAKRSRGSAQEKRKQQIADAAAEVVADATRSPSARANRSRKYAKGNGIPRNESATSSTPAEATQNLPSQGKENATPAKAKRKYTKRKQGQSVEEAAARLVEAAVQGLSNDSNMRGRKRKRAPTPESAETIQITPSEVKMMDLCRDGGTGRKSEREKELEELGRAEFIRKKQTQLNEVMGDAELEIQATPLESTETRQEQLVSQREKEDNVAHNVPNTIIVNGQIQIDESSLEIDRHAAAALERNLEQLDAIDETDMTRKVNSATWLKRDQSGGWNEMLTERFYDGLRMFGTDFEMISKMFPGRTRHKIKLKFCKEERINGDRIKATLLGEILAVDLPELEKMAGTEFDDPKELEKDLEEDRIRLEEETAAEKQAMDDAKRERQEQIALEQAAAENDSSAKENRRGKGKKKRSNHTRGEKSKRSASRKKDRLAQKAASTGGDGHRELAEASRVEA